MFNHVQVQINKSETTIATISVPPWELPVLAAVHGDDRIVPTGVTVPVSRPKPDAAAEFDRLTIKYKQNRETGVDYVASVYGTGSLGVRRLADEMAREGESDEPVDEKFVQVEDADDPLGGLFDDQPAATAAGAVSVDR